MRNGHFIAPIVMILLLSSSLLLFTAGGEDERDRREANLAGMVVDADTGDGVVAVVHVVNRDKEILFSIETGEDGTFSASLPEGVFTYEADAEGYESARGDFTIRGDGQLTLTMELQPLRSIRPNLFGRLVSAVDREGIPGAVAFYSERSDIEPFKIETKRDGSFELPIPPGMYMYEAYSEGFEPARGRVEIGREPVKLIIPLKPVAQRELGVVAGFVFHHEGEPVPGAQVVIFPFPHEPRILEDGMVVDENSVSIREPEPFMTRTDERGHFKIQVPFGAYEISVEARGFEPFFGEVKLGAEKPEVFLRVELIPLERERKPEGIRFVFRYVDENSDGNPERVYRAADLDGDGTFDFEFEYIDRNSDGNPEVMERSLNLPGSCDRDMLPILLMLLKEVFSGEEGEYEDWGDEFPMPPMRDPDMEDEDWWGDDGEEFPPDEGMTRPPRQEDIDEENGEMKEDTDPEEEEIKEPTTGEDDPSIKEGSRGEDVIFPIIAGSVLIIAAFIIIITVLIRKRR